MWFYKAVFLPFYSDLLVLPRERLLVLPALCNWSPRVLTLAPCPACIAAMLFEREVLYTGNFT